jgi:hypothetical protein
MRGVCAELTLCGGETYAKVSNIGLQIYCVTAAPRRHSTGLSHLAPTTGLRVMAQHLCLSFRPSKPGLRPATESRNPVIKAVRAFTPAVDYWVPARAIPVEPGSLGRDDSPYAIALP